MRVKICGMRSVADVEAAARAGADAVGFVFAASPRRLEPDEARPLIDAVPEGLIRVGVLRGLDSGPLDEILDLGLDAIQFESGPVPREFPGLQSWVVLRDSADLLERADRFGPNTLLLVDSAVGGGSGEAADHERVARLAARRRIMLAGGLDPANVAAAIRAVRPCGVDVSSGVESAPGQKSAALIAAFVHAAREAVAQLPEGAIPKCP